VKLAEGISKLNWKRRCW